MDRMKQCAVCHVGLVMEVFREQQNEADEYEATLSKTVPLADNSYPGLNEWVGDVWCADCGIRYRVTR